MAAYFISGASSGIGAELARQLAARGDAVALAARRTDRLTALADELSANGAIVSVHELDVTDAAAVDREVRAADAVLGGLDVVVANAGRGGGAVVGDGHHDRNVGVLETNLVGVFAQAEVALSLFRPRGVGHLVLVSSVAGTRGLPGSSASYSVSKAGVLQLGRALRTDLAGSGIDVTVVIPGWVSSEMTERVPERVKTDVETAVASMLDSIDARRGEAYVPRWWRLLARGVLPLVPGRVLRRFL
ncbi:SDR family NAD(P)-dependent oxidoreductase [Salsipaludibacter albus]|uniref:SDR family NAD(P)-dependent oxidoreductase n=1 Tax=Salsipaludibacter albus TaxID=2849650 RepID=UPI001EE43D65|nr:SDR family NAD(P)-dependent oxidoreductase [Salsipaludibacter albus]MBY5162947.1 SDR family NAD(P)-dependent oxidoreductase [Salsipaludibacter albus]